MRLSKHEREKGCYIAVVLFNRHIRAAVAPSSSLCLGTKKGGVMSTVFDISSSMHTQHTYIEEDDFLWRFVLPPSFFPF